MHLTSTGTKIGQASECFVYWRDTSKNDTWGLNFTSPVDAKQFRDCCVSENPNNNILKQNILFNVYTIFDNNDIYSATGCEPPAI